MDKKIQAQLEKLKGDEWDSDSDNEEVNSSLSNSVESKADYIQLGAEAAKSHNIEQLKAKNAKNKNNTQTLNTKQSSVVYLGRIPHGFYEKQMRGFFKQFGSVRRVRLSRNKRTGNSKHYAFILFDEPEVAEIVASTMNNYRLFDHTLSCHVVPVDKIHERMFDGADHEFKPYPWKRMAREQHNAEKTHDQIIATNKNLVRQEKQKRKILQALGVDYDFPGYEACVPAKKTHKVFAQD